jgi:geranylgeranyl pyrophosphate synthase
MAEAPAATGPFQFTEQDLTPERLAAGTEQTLADFYRWRDANPGAVADHIDSYTNELLAAAADHTLGARLGRRLTRGGREAFDHEKIRSEIGFFCVYNLAEVPDQAVIETFRDRTIGTRMDLDSVLREQRGKSGVDAMVGAIEHHLPPLRGAPELKWLSEQLTRLHRILPERVVQDGGMGKAARTAAGVLTIGAYDTLYDSRDVKKAHLTRILPAAYAYGAMYPIIDDTLQDSDYVSESDKQRYHETILEGIRNGTPIDSSRLPDHPLAEELQRLYDILLDTFPHDQYPHLYLAGESMYLAQDRDSKLTTEAVALGGLASIYPDVFQKAAMTRVVANILGRRNIGNDYYANSININFINQLRDDLQDREKDMRNGQITPFACEPSAGDTNPLYDLFAYSAYIEYNVFNNDPRAAQILTRFSAVRLAAHLFSDDHRSRDLRAAYTTTPQIKHFMHTAGTISKGTAERLQREDIKLQATVGALFKNRPRTDADPRTFVTDQLQYINDVIREYTKADKHRPLQQIAEYALDAGGKRLRPALTLMLAESLGLEYKTVEPLLAAVELYHTSSLVFDDMPAQDNAKQRRGKPTAHIAFGEANAQLAGIGMISAGFGVLAELNEHYPQENVNEIIKYFGLVLGPDRLCHGQYLDLAMERGTEAVTTEKILEMYDLKTSTMIEAALVPLLMLTDRPAAEIELVKKYAHHAGIVFQLRDDILDMTASAETLGKDAGNDEGKTNIARLQGIPEAERLMHAHLNDALQSLQALPFNTNLLQGIVSHFATRHK